MEISMATSFVYSAHYSNNDKFLYAVKIDYRREWPVIEPLSSASPDGRRYYDGCAMFYGLQVQGSHSRLSVFSMFCKS